MLTQIKEQASTRAPVLARGPRIVTAAAACISLAALVGIGIWFAQARRAESAGPAHEASPTEFDPDVVEISPAKLAAMRLEAQPVQYRSIQQEHRVPGRVGYNASRRLEVKMPVDGVVMKVLVQPGQEVKQGDPLAVVSSVGVGIARDEVVNSEAAAALAQRDRDWADEVARNLEQLQERLQQLPAMADVEREFRGQKLGDHRDTILSAYSKLLLARDTLAASESLGASGALPEITIRERRSASEVAGASFQGVCEQSRFDAAQRRASAQAKLEHDQRLVAVNRQKLRLQLGPFAEVSATPTDSSLCEVVLKAAMDGLVEERLVTEGAHFAAAQNLFVLANTDTLWVSAQIYERDWAGFSERDVPDVLVECPAVPERPLRAKTLFVSVVASPESRAVPLVAELANDEGRFKPGMFAWVTVPFGAARSALAVPASAITRHEQQPFVFVEEQPGTYRKVDVTLGTATADWVEVTGGLERGERVVTNSAFLLKSELLLRGMQD